MTYEPVSFVPGSTLVSLFSLATGAERVPTLLLDKTISLIHDLELEMSEQRSDGASRWTAQFWDARGDEVGDVDVNLRIALPGSGEYLLLSSLRAAQLSGGDIKRLWSCWHGCFITLNNDYAGLLLGEDELDQQAVLELLNRYPYPVMVSGSYGARETLLIPDPREG